MSVDRTSKPSLRFQAVTMLADMRRKYMHAKAMGWEAEGSFLKGEPISARILEGWIPVIERIVDALPDETTACTCPGDYPASLGHIASCPKYML